MKLIIKTTIPILSGLLLFQIFFTLFLLGVPTIASTKEESPKTLQKKTDIWNNNKEVTNNSINRSDNQIKPKTQSPYKIKANPTGYCNNPIFATIPLTPDQSVYSFNTVDSTNNIYVGKVQNPETAITSPLIQKISPTGAVSNFGDVSFVPGPLFANSNGGVYAFNYNNPTIIKRVLSNNIVNDFIALAADEFPVNAITDSNNNLI